MGALDLSHLMQLKEDDRIAVMEMVKEGELSVEEAVVRRAASAGEAGELCERDEAGGQTRGCIARVHLRATALVCAPVPKQGTALGAPLCCCALFFCVAGTPACLPSPDNYASYASWATR